MNHTIIQFCRKLMQQVLAGLLALALFLTLGFTLLDSGESILIQSVSSAPAANLAQSPVQVQLQLTQCSLKLELQLGQRRHISYQRILHNV